MNHESHVVPASLPSDTPEIIKEDLHEEGAHRPSDPHKHGPAHSLPKTFVEVFDRIEGVEDRLQLVLRWMQDVLVGSYKGSFGIFWELRQRARDLFANPISQAVRIQLWAQYTELCREARKLKEVFDEQSSFFSEQIEATIIAIKDDFTNIEAKIAQMEPRQEIEESSSLQAHAAEYQRMQHELDYLNAFASRISSSRREVIKAQIRTKQKRRLLDDLSTLGDLIFPRRKELIQQVSQFFKKDVSAFIGETFVGELGLRQLIGVQEEIRRLQRAARQLTLSTEAFATTREQLSECWNGLMQELSEKRKAHHERQMALHKHKEELSAMLDLIRQGIESGSMNEAEARRSLHQLHSRLRSLPVASGDLKLLRQQIFDIESKLDEKRDQVAPRVRGPEGSAVEGQRKKELFDTLAALSQRGHEADEAMKELRNILQRAMVTHLSRTERLHFSAAYIHAIRHLEALLRRQATPDLKGREELERILGSICDCYDVAKEHAQLLRKCCGDSGASFTEAMELTDLLAGNNEILKQIESLHGEVEAHLMGLQGD